MLRPGEAARRLGIAVRPLQSWDRAARPRVVRSPGNRRGIPESEGHRLKGEQDLREPILYAEASFHGQKDDRDGRKERVLRAFPGAELRTDIGSGLKLDCPGFFALLKAGQERRVSRVVVTYKDRLARFGVDLLRQVLAAHGSTLQVLDSKQSETPERELGRELIAVITSFSARLYGLRSSKTKKLLASARAVVKDP